MWRQFLLVAAAVLLAACGRGPEDTGTAPTTIFVSIAPQAQMVERLAGDDVRVEVLVPPGKSPHVYEPSPRQLAELGQAAAFVTIGVPFEEQVIPRIRQAYPDLTIIDSIADIERVPIGEHEEHDEHEAEAEHDHDHDHEHEHEHEHAAEAEHDHDHEGVDPHVWLAPPLLEQMARTVAAGLVDLPALAEAPIEENLGAYVAEVEAVHAHLQDQLAPYAGRHIYVFHPAFGYFARTYGLHQEAVELGGKSPTPKQLQELIAAAKAEQVKVIFVQPQFDRRSAETVADAIGGAVVPLDPLARDVLGNLRDIGKRIGEALAGETP